MPSRPGSFTSLPRRAQAFILLSFGLAGACVALTSLAFEAPRLDPWLLAVALAICAAANLLEVLAPGHYSLQPNLAFFFCAAVLLPPWALVPLAVACFVPRSVVPQLSRARSPAGRPEWFKVAFNIANYGLCGLLAQLVVLGVTGAQQRLLAPEALALAALAFAALNHLLIVIVVSLVAERKVRKRLRQITDGLPVDLALAATGGLLAVLWQARPALLLLAAGPLTLVYRALWVPQLRHQAETDPKTGLYNFQYLRQHLDQALASARRHDSALAVIMVDLDHLRAINDRLGHLAGDRVICAVAEALEEQQGARGIAARFGGEEFCLLLPGASQEMAMDAAEELRGRVAALRFRDSDRIGPEGSELTVTLSAGIASFPEHAQSADGLLEAADEAVYEAKRRGRNRVRGARSSLALETELARLERVAAL